jgi:hypothetical protein
VSDYICNCDGDDCKICYPSSDAEYREELAKRTPSAPQAAKPESDELVLWANRALPYLERWVGVESSHTLKENATIVARELRRALAAQPAPASKG